MKEKYAVDFKISSILADKMSMRVEFIMNIPLHAYYAERKVGLRGFSLATGYEVDKCTTKYVVCSSDSGGSFNFYALLLPPEDRFPSSRLLLRPFQSVAYNQYVANRAT